MQREEKNHEELRHDRALVMIERQSNLLATQIATNANEHTAIQIGAARTEEQLKALGAKMDEISRTLEIILRQMTRDNHLERKSHG
jgi:hypothetical protein